MQIASCQRPIIAAILASALILISQASAATVSVDPAVSLTNYWSVEWNTNGNLEGWTISSATNASVTNGTLTGTASTTDPQIQWLNFASGPDLDLAFNDYLDLRIQVPASYAGNIQVFYGTTNTTGISGSRVLTIPNSSIPADGAFHTYRLDLALEQTWRGTLRDLRIDPVSVAGASFAIDFIRIGDLTGDLYYPNTTDQAVTTNELSSKHFRFIWDLNRATNSGMNATWAHGNLRNAEEVWAVYVKAFGYREPSESTDAARRDGRKFKVNFLCVNDGYWMSGSGTGYAYLNIDPSGLRVDPPTWVTPHEGMHVFQMHQGGSMPGEWWEGHANYGRERWIDFYDTLFAGQSGIDAAAIENGHMTIAIGRDYYLTWPLFLYLDENPDGLPDLGEGTVAKIWQTNAGGVYPYATIEQLTTNTSVKDVVGCFARRMLTLDFSHQTAITNALNTQNPAEWQRYQITELERRSDDTNWGRVPMEMAPQQGGYAIHELVPIGTNKVVSVNFRGLPDAARGADWRASFVALATNGVERYTPLWNAGTNTVTLASNESRLFLVVAATPDQFVYTGHDDLTYPYRSHPSKQRLHYEVQVFNATPKERDNGSTSGLVQHANGGGWKASTATVDSTAYLGPNARVLNTAKVRNNARVEDFAVVQNTAIVSNNAVISGHALVCDSAVVRDSAKVRDWAIAGGTVVISGNARVIEHARMLDGTVGDFATAKGSAWSQGGLALGGYGAIDGDFMGGRVVTNGFAYGHMPYVGVPDDWVRVVPDRLYAAYEFAAANDSMARDLYGATDAWLRGHPTWVGNDTRHFGVLSFDGAGDYVELDKSVGDWKDFTITAWAKWQGGAPNEPIVFLGSGTNKCLWLTPDDGAGHVKFTIRSNTLEQTLTAVAPAPVGVWTHLVVALSNNVGLLYVNGALAASGTVTLDPDQLFAGNSNAAPKTHFLARGADAAQPFFHGSLDSVRFYSKALSADEVAWLYAPAPNAGTVYVDLRATQPSAGTTNWLNLGTLGNFARVGSPSFVSNVASTGIPGVQFSGSGQAYQGPNSVPNLEGDSDRSIEVWAYNQSLASEETMVSWGHRGSTRQNMGFNFGNSTGWGAVTHYNDDVPWIAVPSSNAWHHLVYVYSNSIVKVYVDGVVNNTKTLGGALGTFTNEPINLACQRDSSNGTRSVYFSGYINSVRIHGGALTDDQVAANYLAGPAVPTPVINVAATQPVRVVDSRQFGINAAVWDSNFSATNTLALLREADCRILRFPGGSLADEYHWATGRSGTNTWNWATTFTEFAQAVTNLGAQAIVTVNYGSGTPEEAAAWVAHANVTNRYGFLYWEVGNEIYGTWETDTNSLPHDAYTYATRAAAYFTQMKATDPTIKIGIPVVPSETDYANGYTNHPVVNPRTGTTRTGWTPVVLTTLRSLGVRPDFVVYHRYAQSPGSENDAALLQSSKSWTNDAITLRQMVSDYLGTNSALTELFCTENNSVYSGPGKQTTSLVNGLFLADSFCQLMKTEFRALVWWDLRNGQHPTQKTCRSLRIRFIIFHNGPVRYPRGL